MPRSKSSITIVAALILALKFQASVLAQGNVADLHNWTGQTQYASSPNYGVLVLSASSAMFTGAYSTNPPGHIVPGLGGSLATFTGATYDVSFTVANDPSHAEVGNGTMWFGSYSYNIDLYAMGAPGSSQNYNFLLVAPSSTTPMSFSWTIDNGYQATLSNLSVSEVPETSTIGLFSVGGALWLLAKARRWLPLSKSHA